MTARAFMRALELVERTPMKDWEQLPSTPMVDLAQEFFGLRAVGRL